MDAAQVILGFCIVSLLLYLLNTRVVSPVFAILNRWTRWILFALSVAFLATELGWTGRPFWVVALTAFLGWFLVESAYHWLAIRALSNSPLPLFPRFSVNESGDEWPTQRRLIGVRDWLRRQGYRQVQALRAEIAPGIHLRVSVFHDNASETRIQIAFIPQPKGGVAMCHTLSTPTADGRRFVTDNLYLPFGGFYPENWRLERRPWTRSLPALLQHHQRRLRAAKVTPAPWTTEPLDDLNHQQSQLERLNTELGFLVPHHARDEHGKLTPEGRYRVWKEVWLLNYLGRAVGY
jgi:hypothetical protein